MSLKPYKQNKPQIFLAKCRAKRVSDRVILVTPTSRRRLFEKDISFQRKAPLQHIEKTMQVRVRLLNCPIYNFLLSGHNVCAIPIQTTYKITTSIKFAHRLSNNNNWSREWPFNRFLCKFKKNVSSSSQNSMNIQKLLMVVSFSFQKSPFASEM